MKNENDVPSKEIRQLNPKIDTLMHSFPGGSECIFLVSTY